MDLQCTDVEEAKRKLLDEILTSAMNKPFYKNLLLQGGFNYEDDSNRNACDVMGNLLSSAIISIAERGDFQKWKSQAEIRLLCLGGVMDLRVFYDVVGESCRPEIEAYLLVESSWDFEGDFEAISQKVRRVLRSQDYTTSIDWEEEGEQDDHDHVNGRYVNKEHKELFDLYDAASTEKEKDDIHKRCISLYKTEAKKNSPLALFYLGVAYLNGSNVKKDMKEGRRLLERAHELGVERAMDVLVPYFADYR